MVASRSVGRIVYVFDNSFPGKRAMSFDNNQDLSSLVFNVGEDKLTSGTKREIAKYFSAKSYYLTVRKTILIRYG